MYCTQCGHTLTELDRFCSHCGRPTGAGHVERKLMLSRYDRKIAGVCGGVAEYLGVDPTLIRLIWVALVFLPPSIGLIAYLIAWIVMPREPLRVAASVPAAS